MLDLNTAFATFPVLETERLVLRAVNAEDTDDIFRICGDAQVMRYFGKLPMTSTEEAAARVRDLAAAFQQRSGMRWAITRRGANRLLGTCGYWRLISEHMRAEIGYELAQDAWGQGLMPEAINAILGWGFTVLNLHSAEAQIDPANNGSRRVLEKCGFVQEGYFRENYYSEGQFTDTAVFSLLRSVWQERHQAYYREHIAVSPGLDTSQRAFEQL